MCADQVAEHLAGQVGGGARTRRSEAALGRILLEQSHQLGHGADPQRGADKQHVGQHGHQGHRLEVLDRVVGQVLVQAGVDGVGADGAAEQRVAVGLGLGHVGGAHGAGRAGLVVDDERLAEGRLQLFA
jgi:hypothetical protein